KAAQAHAENMARQGKLEHTLDGKGLRDRLQAAGYDAELADENLASVQGLVVQGGFDSWMGSQVHRGLLLGDKFQEAGIGLARTDKGEVYYTMVFGVGKAAPTPMSDEKAFKEAVERVVALTNEERAKQKLPPLKLNTVLCEVARGHSA